MIPYVLVRRALGACRYLYGLPNSDERKQTCNELVQHQRTPSSPSS